MKNTCFEHLSVFNQQGKYGDYDITCGVLL